MFRPERLHLEAIAASLSRASPRSQVTNFFTSTTRLVQAPRSRLELITFAIWLITLNRSARSRASLEPDVLRHVTKIPSTRRFRLSS